MNPKSNEEEHYYTKQPKSQSRLGLVSAYLRGHYFQFQTSSSVFSRERIDLGTRLLIEAMFLPETGQILDLGCGYGPIGIVAAALNPGLHVFMVDINKRAVWLAKENKNRIGVNNVEILHGDLYKPVENMKFDVILCNPPVSVGMKIVSQIVSEAPGHLRESGLFQIVIRSRVGGRQLIAIMEKTFGNVEIIARKSGYRVLLSKKS
ncbi:MAG: class I SAM-dependent methyltransferase [Candidatus Bathyarchaeota archaeon]|nr:MAG: class I SAM-dependent methyltransferase [Candidatus Bathyarchaeota archaeon]